MRKYRLRDATQVLFNSPLCSCRVAQADCAHDGGVFAYNVRQLPVTPQPFDACALDVT